MVRPTRVAARHRGRYDNPMARLPLACSRRYPAHGRRSLDHRLLMRGTWLLAGAVLLGGWATGCRSPKVPVSAPGAVAVAYTSDIFSGNLNEAAALVLPSYRSEFRVLQTIMATNTGSATNLAPGDTTFSGNTAVVVVTGTICGNSPSATPSASPAPRCLTNSDPNSSNPGFRVALEKSANNQWFIYFPLPTASP